MELFPKPDIVLLQLVPFVLLLLTLPKLVFHPLLDYLEERRRRIEGFAHDAGSMSTESERKEREIEQQIQAARAAVVDLRSGILRTAQDEQQRILTEARGTAEARTLSFREELQTARDREAVAIRRDADELGGMIAARLLGRSLS